MLLDDAARPHRALRRAPTPPSRRTSEDTDVIEITAPGHSPTRTCATSARQANGSLRRDLGSAAIKSPRIHAAVRRADRPAAATGPARPLDGFAATVRAVSGRRWTRDERHRPLRSGPSNWPTGSPRPAAGALNTWPWRRRHPSATTPGRRRHPARHHRQPRFCRPRRAAPRRRRSLLTVCRSSTPARPTLPTASHRPPFGRRVPPPVAGPNGLWLAQLAGQQFDLVINATSASLSDAAPDSAGLYAPGSLATT